MRTDVVAELRAGLLQLVFVALIDFPDDLFNRALELRAQSRRTVVHKVGDDGVVLRAVALRASARAQR